MCELLKPPRHVKCKNNGNCGGAEGFLQTLMTQRLAKCKCALERRPLF